jgi:hypothetical protein
MYSGYEEAREPNSWREQKTMVSLYLENTTTRRVRISANNIVVYAKWTGSNGNLRVSDISFDFSLSV